MDRVVAAATVQQVDSVRPLDCVVEVRTRQVLDAVQVVEGLGLAIVHGLDLSKPEKGADRLLGKHVGNSVRAAATIEIVVVVYPPGAIELRVVGAGIEHIVSAVAVELTRGPTGVEENIVVVRSIDRQVLNLFWSRHSHLLLCRTASEGALCPRLAVACCESLAALDFEPRPSLPV